MNMSMRMSVAIMMLLSVCCGSVYGQVIGHRDIKKLERMREETGEKIKSQTWIVFHSEMGDGIIQGMERLKDEDWKKYRLQTEIRRTNRLRGYEIKGELESGKVYGISRGNPKWERKLKFVAKCLDEGGWIEAKHKRDEARKKAGEDEGLVMVMNLMGYRDFKADAEMYCEKTSDLEVMYPDLVVVYVTMPLRDERSEENVKINVFNRQVRQFCRERDKLLLDLADIESMTPEGKPVSFSWDGQTYQRLHRGYTRDGATLNERGQDRVAKGWYVAAWAANERQKRQEKKRSR